MSEENTTDFAAERLRLEREALALERERLAAARAHAEVAARLSRPSHPFLMPAFVALLVLLSFAGGLIAGMVVADGRQERQRKERLARALSQLDGLTKETSGTNVVKGATGGEQAPAGEHGNVSVLVIE